LVATGGAGVDLFFVLSGFLITRILLRDKGQPNYLRNFYMRRVLRIFPLYYAALLLVFFIVIPLFAHRTAELTHIAQWQPWLWLYGGNAATSFLGIRWDADPIALNHFWSLAVEEHFYLLWPMLVLALSCRKLLVACSCFVGVAVVSKLVFLKLGMTDAVYQFTLSRLDGLALGAATALVEARLGSVSALIRPARYVMVLSIIFLATLVFAGHKASWLWWTTATTHTVFNAFFWALLVLTVEAPTRSAVSYLFTSPVLCFFGRYSYGLYVWHYMMRPGLEQFIPPKSLQEICGCQIAGLLVFAVIAISISCVAALISWHAYEKHFLSLKRHFAPA
jgi:peptidoglycan/LPS O-acetylase OafA/YrhL